MKQFFLLAIMILGTGISLAQPDMDFEDIVTEISEAIDLDDGQSKALEKHMGNYAMSLKEIFDKDDKEEEPEPKEMMASFKHAKENYHKALKADIGNEKFKAYEAYTEQVKLEVLGEAAEMRLIDLQEPLELTDDQIEGLKPVMAKGMMGIMGTLVEVSDAKMNLRTKMKVGNSMKKTKKAMESGMSEILSEEQMAKWKAMREEAKEKKKD